MMLECFEPQLRKGPEGARLRHDLARFRRAAALLVSPAAAAGDSGHCARDILHLRSRIGLSQLPSRGLMVRRAFSFVSSPRGFRRGERIGTGRPHGFHRSGGRMLEGLFHRLCRIALILNLRFKRVTCRGLQALPLGSAHQPAYGAATSLSSIGSKSVWTTRTPQGTWIERARRRRVRRISPCRAAPDRSRSACSRSVAARRRDRRCRPTPADARRPPWSSRASAGSRAPG